jgi:hypothetical protein
MKHPLSVRQVSLWVVLAFLLALIPVTGVLAQSADTSQAITATQALTTTEMVTEVITTAEASAPMTETVAAAEAAPAEAPAAPAEVPATGEAAPAADAAIVKTAQNGPVPADKLCIEGTVINFDETPLTDGWIIVATPLDENGEPIIDATIPPATSDRRGFFRFEEGLFPGIWRLTKEPKEGYSSVTAESFDVELAWGMRGCVQVRFKQRPEVPVVVIKIDDNYVPQPGWIIRAEPGARNVFALPKEITTNANGEALFILTPGSWIFTEKAPPGVSYTPVLPFGGHIELNVTAPGPHTLYFKNRIGGGNGCIESTKYDVPPNGMTIPLPGWRIEVHRANGSLAAARVTDINGYVRFDNLPPGPYTVSEEQRVGWAPVSATSFSVHVTDSRECQRVEFLNIQAPPEICIEGRKIDTNGKIGLPNWQIYADPQDKGGYKPADVYTDGRGMYKFVFPQDDYRIPGARYKVCEVVQAGWLPHTPTCYTVTLPKKPGACVKVPDFENQQVGHGRTSNHPQPPMGGCQMTHVVRAGEGLYAVGASYGVRGREMIAANPWVRSRPHHYLYVGDKLCIP